MEKEKETPDGSEVDSKDNLDNSKHTNHTVEDKSLKAKQFDTNKDTDTKECNNCNTKETQLSIVLQELGKIRRQNAITHCLLSTLIVVTAVWQFSELSLLLLAKNMIKEKLSNPLRTMQGAITGALRGTSGSVQEQLANLSTPSKASKLEVSPLPPVGVPDLSHADLPSLALDGGEGSSKQD